MLGFISLFYFCPLGENRRRFDIKKNEFFCSVLSLHYLCRREMKRLFLILAMAVTRTALTGAKAHAAPAVEDPLDNLELPSVLQKTFAGYYHFIEPSTGDTLAMIVFNPIIIYPRERFRNKAEEKYYWKTVRDVKKTLPYAKLISSTLLETYEYIDTYQTQKQKQAYLKRLFWMP